MLRRGVLAVNNPNASASTTAAFSDTASRSAVLALPAAAAARLACAGSDWEICASVAAVQGRPLFHISGQT